MTTASVGCPLCGSYSHTETEHEMQPVNLVCPACLDNMLSYAPSQYLCLRCADKWVRLDDPATLAARCEPQP